MSNNPSPRADALRAMREAKFDAEQKRQSAAKPKKAKPTPTHRKVKKER